MTLLYSISNTLARFLIGNQDVKPQMIGISTDPFMQKLESRWVR